MVHFIDASENTPAHCVTTFTPYSLSVILHQVNAGLDIVGMTTDKFNGLNIEAKCDHFQHIGGAVILRNPPVMPHGGAKVEQMSAQEKALRDLWTAKGVSQGRQDALIAQVKAKAAPGAQVGPFTLQ